MDIENQQYPIGRFIPKNNYTSEELIAHINVLKEFPQKLRALVHDLNDEQLNTPYRDGSWTIMQLVHHCADSHMNSLTRFKWTLTENEPTIKAYEQDDWAKLSDYNLPIDVSLSMLDGIHAKLGQILSNLKEDEFTKIFHHPEFKEPISISQIIAMYAWHSEHHLAHIRNAKV